MVDPVENLRFRCQTGTTRRSYTHGISLLCGSEKPLTAARAIRGSSKLIGLLAAVTLEQIHGIYRHCVASNGVFVHGGLLWLCGVFRRTTTIYR